LTRLTLAQLFLLNGTDCALVQDYGEDSDLFVFVSEGFSACDAESFISFELVNNAIEREIMQQGVRLCSASTLAVRRRSPVIYPRCGRDGITAPIEVFYSIDTMQLAGKVAATFLRLGATICMVDSGGVGGGVVDRLRQLQFL